MRIITPKDIRQRIFCIDAVCACAYIRSINSDGAAHLAAFLAFLATAAAFGLLGLIYRRLRIRARMARRVDDIANGR